MQKRSSNSAGIRYFKMDYEKVMRKIREYAERVFHEKQAKAVILIGSLARGDYTAFSDADVIIVSDDVPENFMDRLKEFMDPTFPIDLDPRVYTSEEFLKMAKDGRKIIGEVIKYGKLLAGDEGIMKKVKEEYSRLLSSD
ncbi:MAG: nucleotidyltransferase domain-containing protein [Candidatus Asgardarchaeia archaeon]